MKVCLFLFATISRWGKYMPNSGKEIFISWAGDKARGYADNLYDLLKIAFPNNIKLVYLNKKEEEGALWSKNLFDAIKKVKLGIIILTHESIKSQWVNFESGGIFARKNSNIIPIYVDIDRKILESSKSPFRFLFTTDQYKQYTPTTIHDLIKRIKNDFSWKISSPTKLNDRITENVNTFLKNIAKNRAIVDWLYTHNITPLQKDGCIAELDEDKFHLLRKEIVKNTNINKNDDDAYLFISGQSLSEAFDGNAGNTYIGKEIKQAVKDGRIKTINIFITDSTLLNGISETANRIEGTLIVLKDSIFPICEEKKCNISVIFLPLLQIDHSVITNELMAFRSTKLWTRDEEYKGSWKIYSCNDEYKAHKAYLEALKTASTRIDPLIDAEITSADNDITKKQKELRKNIFDNRYKHISLMKLYNDQLIDFVKDKWDNSVNIRSSFIKSTTIEKIEDLFVVENLLGDNTQRVLLNHIKETENMFNDVIKKYDSSDNSGAVIYPSLDLGISNNIQRIAGGFATGMFVMWKCGTPIIPIDTTVNVCSSSVFKLKSFDKNALSSQENFKTYVKEIIDRGHNERGYSFSFDKGNHFLIIANDKNDCDSYYLIMHSSAQEYKDSYLGLYPVEHNWYDGKVKKYPPQGEKNRYFHYLKDNDAKQFYFLANALKGYNEQIHRWFAEQCNVDLNVTFKNRNTFHHYYMPSKNSIAMGTFVEEPGTIVPIFSNSGQPICMFEISHDNWKVKIDGKDKCIIPHGWGQEIITSKDEISISIDGVNNTLTIDDEQYEIKSTERIKAKQKKIRNFKSESEFINKGLENFMKGEVVQTLIPIFTYQGKID